MDVARHDFLADAAFARDQHGSFGRRDLVGEGAQFEHHRIVCDQGAIVVGHGGEDRGNQFDRAAAE